MTKKVILVFTFLIIIFSSSFACTNFLVTKGASADGSTMISYNADSHLLYGELYHWAAATYPEGTLLDVYEWDTGKFLGKIKQARRTYNVIGNINEYQVAIGETTYGGRKELHHQPKAQVDYGSLMYIALQRSKSAREAIKVMTTLVNEYGYYSHGESFSIADKDEVWILEMIGKGETELGAVWVARMIPDGYICGHANQSRITTFPRREKDGAIPFSKINKIFDKKITTVYADDVISFAKKHGFYKGKDKNFSFSDTYAPLDFGAARFCEARVWAMFRQANADMEQYEGYAMGFNLENRMPLWIKPDHKITLKDMIRFMGDHFEGTKMDMTKDVGAGAFENPYRWRPLTWKVDGVEYMNERATATQQTGFTFITQGRNWLPDPIGGIIWFGVDDAALTVYNPIFCGSTRAPDSYKQGFGSMTEFNPDAAFWVFNQVSNFAYTRYNYMAPIIKDVQATIEDKFIRSNDDISKVAAQLYQKDKDLALDFITDYSTTQADNTVKEWKTLYRFLFTKFMDGNIKKTEGRTFIDNGENRGIPVYPDQPGYGEDWYRLIIEKTGDKLKYYEKKP